MMTDERLAELRKWRDVLRSEQMNAEFPRMEAIADAVDEIDRLLDVISSHRCGQSDNHNFRHRSMVDVLGRPT